MTAADGGLIESFRKKPFSSHFEKYFPHPRSFRSAGEPTAQHEDRQDPGIQRENLQPRNVNIFSWRTWERGEDIAVVEESRPRKNYEV